MVERFRVYVGPPNWCVNVEVRADITESRHADPDWVDARAAFVPTPASKSSLGHLVFGWSDIDNATISHEAYHVVKEAEARRIRKFSNDADREEFFARCLDRTVNNINKRLEEIHDERQK